MAEVKNEVSASPNEVAADDYIEFTNKHEDMSYLVPGDKLAFSGLKEKPGLKLIEAKAEQMASYKDRDEDVYGDCDSQVKVTVHADSSMYKNDGDSCGGLLKDVETWLCGEYGEYMKVLEKELKPSEGANHLVIFTLILDTYIVLDYVGGITASSFFDGVWNKHMNSLITEGVCYIKGKVPGTLQGKLRRRIDEMAQKIPIDYHPNSDDIVRDLVHPALYSYVKGVSKMGKHAESPVSDVDDDDKDFWGRQYEDSKFQWLPAPFKITQQGNCLIREYINNLDKTLFADLYKDLEGLFEVFLPYFEDVWSYAKSMSFFIGEDDYEDDSSEVQLEKQPVSFNGQELQVITKIVEYTLQPGQAYEGVWHAEGMSHENIVMTGEFISN